MSTAIASACQPYCALLNALTPLWVSRARHLPFWRHIRFVANYTEMSGAVSAGFCGNTFYTSKSICSPVLGEFSGCGYEGPVRMLSFLLLLILLNSFYNHYGNTSTPRSLHWGVFHWLSRSTWTENPEQRLILNGSQKASGPDWFWWFHCIIF